MQRPYPSLLPLIKRLGIAAHFHGARFITIWRIDLFQELDVVPIGSGADFLTFRQREDCLDVGLYFARSVQFSELLTEMVANNGKEIARRSFEITFKVHANMVAAKVALFYKTNSGDFIKKKQAMVLPPCVVVRLCYITPLPI